MTTQKECYEHALREFKINYPMWPRRDGSCDHRFCGEEKERRRRADEAAVEGCKGWEKKKKVGNDPAAVGLRASMGNVDGIVTGTSNMGIN